MAAGISIREFARRAGCDDKVVRRKIGTGHLPTLDDGSLDPRHVEMDWRSGVEPLSSLADTSDTADKSADTDTAVAPKAKKAAPKKQAAREDDQPLELDGRTFHSKARAERMKENYLAKLRQLEFDKAAGKVVEIDDVVEAIVAEYQLVRARLLSIGARIAPRGAAMRSAEELKALIDREVTSALEELTLDGDADDDLDAVRWATLQRFGPTAAAH